MYAPEVEKTKREPRRSERLKIGRWSRRSFVSTSSATMFTVSEETVASGEESLSGSPTNKIKFLCSYGGKILPRPSDGLLKYVGGETRVVAVRREISFPELMKKLSTLCEGDMVLKYQIIPEDLDAIVSVRSDEDVKHMFEEHDRRESRGFPKLRTFLFPSNPAMCDSQTMAPVSPGHRLEQRYIDAINGVIHTTIQSKLPPVIANRPKFTVSSACSTPVSISPDGSPSEANFPVNCQNSRLSSVHRVHSSPSLYALNSSNPGTPHQHLPQQLQHHHNQIPTRYQPHPYASPRFTPQDFHKGVAFERLPPAGWSPANHGPILYGGLNKCNSGNSCCEDFSGYLCPRTAGSVPQSPRHYGYRLPHGFATSET